MYTDQVIPAHFSKFPRAEAWATHYFADLRFDQNGKRAGLSASTTRRAGRKHTDRAQQFRLGSSRESRLRAGDYASAASWRPASANFAGNAVKQSLVAAIVSAEDVRSCFRRSSRPPRRGRSAGADDQIRNYVVPFRSTRRANAMLKRLDDLHLDAAVQEPDRRLRGEGSDAKALPSASC